jgi:SAM-dependent methyltransferase
VPRNWDEHYSNPDHVDLTPEPLLVEAADLLRPGRALDLACGPGRNALHLARLGWQVTAVDSSAVAIAMLRRHAGGLPVDCALADLQRDEFSIAPEGYRLICDFFYLQRNLFPQIRAGVGPGGVFAGAIHLLDDAPATRPRNPDFLMHPGELRAEFDGWKVIFYSEGGEPQRSRHTARIIARRA